MSYYILPKNINTINIIPTISISNNIQPYLSCTLLNYFNELKKQIHYLCDTNHDLSFNKFEDIIKIINPYEYIITKVPGSKYSVSKLKEKTNIFYDIMELAFTINIFETFVNKNIQMLSISPNVNDTIDCIDLLRENYSDNIFKYDVINCEILDKIKNNTFDFLFFEADDDNIYNYILNLMYVLAIISNNINNEGIVIIKITHIFYKPIVDIIYTLTSLFDKVYIVKPSTSNITTFNKYIVCKKLIKNEKNIINYKINYHRLLSTIYNKQKNQITSILNYDIPCYFLSKLEEINITIGQQQLESLDMIINIFKNKNKNDKIDTLKNINIQKSINWCEKYKIPYNKFIDKFKTPNYKEKNDKIIGQL